MTEFAISSQTIKRHLNVALDKALYWISIYALPLLIAAASLLAWMAWDPKYSSGGGTPTELRSLEQTGTTLSPAEALKALEKESPAGYRDTKLSEAPFWFTFEARPLGDDPILIEIPSRHAVSLACWGAGSLQPLGQADRLESSGAIRSAKSGFVVDLGRMRASQRVLCKGEFVGPARITAQRWTALSFENSAHDFHRRSGLLDGGLIVLAIFVLMTALINRAPVYVLFAAWLIFNLRLGAISAGWDTQWLGQTVPPDWLSESRALTVAGYYTLTGMLFRQMFREELARFGFENRMRAVHAVCLLLLPVAILVPYAKALPIMWVASIGSIGMLLYFLVRILAKTRSNVAFLYGAALSITLFASLYEVIAAAVGVKNLIGAVNSVTAALSSSLMAAFAIAEQIRQERLRRVQAEVELRETYDASPIGLFTLSTGGQFLSANPALLRMLDQTALPPTARWSEFFELDAWLRLQRLLDSGEGGELEIGAATGKAPGEEKRFLVKAARSGERIEGSLQDVTEKAKAIGRLHFLAENDSLTGVFNRRGIEKRLEAAFEGLARGRPLAVAYLDLDRFKLVNDLYGHSAGDEVLKQVCSRVAGMLAEGQLIGRVGGDEFVLVFDGTPIRSAAWTCRGILDRIAEQPFNVGDKAFQVGGSMGLVEVEPANRVSDVISLADQACREAKRGHHEGLMVYEINAAVFREREADLRMLERLSGPDGPEGLFLEMQPLLAVRDPFTALDFEVLLRMRDRDGNLIGADRIIPVAEDKGRIGIIDRWVLASVLNWLNAHGDRLQRTRFVCMNLSGASLNDEHFVADAFELLTRFPRAAKRLCIEITESVALHDLVNMRRFIDAARSVGAKVALDDFGAGYTSFSYLKDLPADVLKIDGAFIRGVNTHPANLAIVEAIVSLARSLGMKTIAEWAEDRATVETLVEAGIDFIQGYAIARPQSPELILAADSSASFIQDERLRQFVRGLATGDTPVAVWDELSPVNPADLH